MAGPADYLRVTGPLGGANFLSVQDYASNDPTSPGKSILGALQQGANIKATRANTQAQEMANEQKRMTIDEAKQAQLDAPVISSFMTSLPSYQSAVQPTATPAVVDTTPQTQVPPAAPTTQAAPAVAAQAPMQPQVSVQQPTPTAQMPAPQQVAVAQPPVATAQPAPTGQVAVAPPTQAAPLAPAVGSTIGQRVINTLQGIDTRIGQFEADKTRIIQGIQDGELTPRQGQKLLAGITSSRDADIATQTKLAENLAEIRQKYESGEKTAEETKKFRVETATAVRKAEDDEIFTVAKLAAVSPEMAMQEATRRGLPVETLFDKDGKPTAALQTRAARSEMAKAASEEERKALGVGTGKDVPAGVREVVIDGKVEFIDADGKKLSQSQISAMNERKARAGATRVGGAPAAGGVTVAGPEGGTINGLSRDARGNITVAPDVLKSVKPLADANANAVRVAREIASIENEGLVDKASASGAGAMVSGAQRFVGLDTDRRKADERLARFANSALGVIESPLMKGAPSEADARRALSVINDPASDTSTKKEAVTQLKSAIADAQTRYSDALSQFDAPTRARLKAIGIDGATESTPTDTGGKTPIVKSQAQYDALPPGTKYVDSAGNVATKR